MDTQLATQLPAITEVQRIAFGTGTIVAFGGLRDDKKAAKAVIRAALDCGYRHFDCAQVYRTEALVGEALGTFFEDRKDVTRQDICISSKLDDGSVVEHGDVKRHCLQSLAMLRVSYVDAYLIHSPFVTPLPLSEVWAEMEGLVRAGLVRRIGVSNFKAQHLEGILSTCTIRPFVNQVELNPALEQPRFSEWCVDRSILVQSYAPLAVLRDQRITGLGPAESKEPMAAIRTLLRDIGNRLSPAKTSAQVALRWNLQRGHSIVTTSSNLDRMRQNIDILNFNLSDSDMAAISECGAANPRRLFFLVGGREGGPKARQENKFAANDFDMITR